MTNGMSASIIVCAYTADRWHDICETIDSLRRQTFVPAQIVLVVDHNKDLLARARAEQWTDVLAIDNRQAPGLSGSRNTGISVSTGDLIGFLDDDAIAASDWLEHLARQCEPSGVLGTTSRIEPLWGVARPRWFPQEFMWTVGCSYLGQIIAAGEVRNLLGGSMLVKRHVFDAISGFHTLLGRSGGNLVSCEETEMCIRAKAMFPDGTFRMVSETKVFHKIPASRTTWHYFRRRCYAEGKSKAYLAKLVRQRTALNNERDYVLRSLTAGVICGISDCARLDLHGLSRAAAIVFGLAATVCGYAIVKLRPDNVAPATPSLPPPGSSRLAETARP